MMWQLHQLVPAEATMARPLRDEPTFGGRSTRSAGATSSLSPSCRGDVGLSITLDAASPMGVLGRQEPRLFAPHSPIRRCRGDTRRFARSTAAWS